MTDNRSIGTDKLASEAVNSQTGTAYTVADSDLGSTIVAVNANPVTVTIPVASTVDEGGGFPVGSSFDVVQGGAGKVSLAIGSPGAFHSRSGFVGTSAQYGKVRALQTAQDVWLLSGDLA